MQNQVTVSIAGFYERFPEFNTKAYAFIVPLCFDRSQIYISKTYRGCARLTGEKRSLAIYLLTAHLSFLKKKSVNSDGSLDGVGNQLSSASVDGVNIGYAPIPEDEDGFTSWLKGTVWGRELLSLLATLTAVPFYIGGSLERVF
jgi:hypothetical protein